MAVCWVAGAVVCLGSSWAMVGAAVGWAACWVAGAVVAWEAAEVAGSGVVSVSPQATMSAAARNRMQASGTDR